MLYVVMLEFEYVHCQSIGDRDVYQDYYSNCKLNGSHFFVMADGLGGHQNGDEASKLICNCLLDEIQNLDEVTSISALRKIVNRALVQYQKFVEDVFFNFDLQTTFVCGWISKESLVCAHVGDSRLYYIHNGSLWHTIDHNQLTELALDPMLRCNQFYQNKLTRSVSIHQIPSVDYSEHLVPKSGDCIILCTDGFHPFLTNAQIINLCSSFNLEQDLNHLLNFCLEQSPDSSDNASVQLIRVK